MTQTLAIYQVDAFTDTLFAGNAAAVVPVTEWLADPVMLQIAAENNLSETAFVKEIAPGHVEIRWFSPLTEIDFCGHATLAAADVWFRLQPELPLLRVSTRQVGDLTVQKGAGGWYLMDFPQRLPSPISEIPAALLAALPAKPIEVLRSSQAWFVVYANAQQIVTMQPDFALLKQLGPYDVVVTAPGADFAEGQYDFVSRYFWPANGGDEDPVTGSIHAGLAPFWGARLAKTELLAYQASTRGGVLRLGLANQRVQVSGQTRLYLQGQIFIPTGALHG